MNNDITKNIKKVLVIFLVLFIALISYIGYFQLFKASTIASSTENKRLWAKRNEVTRGVIYDRNHKVLAETTEKGELSQTRSYPYGEAAVHLVGYMDIRYGITGLESTFDKQLTSYDVISTNLSDFLSKLNVVEAFKNRAQRSEKKGNDLITTIDADLQQLAYDALGKQKGAVVVLNPKTGEILASVSKPSYNPNKLADIWESINKDEEKRPMINRATSGMYPPGSTFKVITTASVLENISGARDKTFKDNGVIKFADGTTIKNAGDAVYGNINLKRALVVSSNIVYGNLAMELGNSALKATAESFGFNKDLSTDDINISKSSFPKLTNDGDIAQSGFGQSQILATPMQMALVASAVANGGVIMEPKLMKEIVSSNGRVVDSLKPKVMYRALPSEDAATIKEYMRAVVKNGLSGSWRYVFNGTDAAGKTGTAETGRAGEEPHSWFIGFAPEEDPQVALAVIVENGGYGSGIAASIAGKLFKAALKD